MLKIIGWVLIPYLMVFLFWKKISTWAKFGVFFLNIFVLFIESLIGVGIEHNPNIGLITAFYIPIQFILYVIFGMINTSKQEKEALLEKSGGAERVITLTHVSGLEVGTTPCNLYLFPDKLRIENTLINQIFEIPIANIYRSEAEQVRKDKSFSFGKAALGEVVAGPVGAIIAGSLGGSKGTVKSLLIIGFITKEKIQRELIFLDNAAFRAINFANALRKKQLNFTIEKPEATVHQL